MSIKFLGTNCCSNTFIKSFVRFHFRICLLCIVRSRRKAIMTNIKRYTKKDGTSAYMFNAYLGKNPLTRKKKRTTRRGFKTKKKQMLRYLNYWWK